MVPTGTGKPGEAERHFPVREKSGNFTQNTGNQKIIILENWKKILENEICQTEKVGTMIRHLGTHTTIDYLFKPHGRNFKTRFTAVLRVGI